MKGRLMRYSHGALRPTIWMIALSICVFFSGQASADWPHRHGDARHTRLEPDGGGMVSAAGGEMNIGVGFKAAVNGGFDPSNSRAADLEEDGQVDVVFVQDGLVTLFVSAYGDPPPAAWSRWVGADTIVAVAQMDNKELNEIVVAGNGPGGRLTVLAGITGGVKYSAGPATAAAGVDANQVVVDNLDPADASSELLWLRKGTGGAVLTYSDLAPAVTKSGVTIKNPDTATLAVGPLYPEIAGVLVDGTDLVVAKATAPSEATVYPNVLLGAHTGPLYLVNVDGDEALEVLVTGGDGQVGMHVFDPEAAGESTAAADVTVWSCAGGDGSKWTPTLQQTVQSGALVNLGGAPTPDLAVGLQGGFYSELPGCPIASSLAVGGVTWSTNIIELATGTVIGTVPNARPVTTTDVDADGQYELLVERTSGAYELLYFKDGKVKTFATFPAPEGQPYRPVMSETFPRPSTIGATTHADAIQVRIHEEFPGRNLLMTWGVTTDWFAVPPDFTPPFEMEAFTGEEFGCGLPFAQYDDGTPFTITFLTGLLNKALCITDLNGNATKKVESLEFGFQRILTADLEGLKTTEPEVFFGNQVKRLTGIGSVDNVQLGDVTAFDPGDIKYITDKFVSTPAEDPMVVVHSDTIFHVHQFEGELVFSHNFSENFPDHIIRESVAGRFYGKDTEYMVLLDPVDDLGDRTLAHLGHDGDQKGTIYSSVTVHREPGDAFGLPPLSVGDLFPGQGGNKADLLVRVAPGNTYRFEANTQTGNTEQIGASSVLADGDGNYETMRAGLGPDETDHFILFPIGVSTAPRPIMAYPFTGVDGNVTPSWSFPMAAGTAGGNYWGLVEIKPLGLGWVGADAGVRIVNAETGVLYGGLPKYLSKGALVSAPPAAPAHFDAVISVNTNQSGASEIVAAGSDGWVYAVEPDDDGNVTLLWSTYIGVPIAQLVSIDWNTDNTASELVALGRDSKLYGLDNTPFKVTITNPTQGALLTNEDVIVTGTVSGFVGPGEACPLADLKFEVDGLLVNDVGYDDQTCTWSRQISVGEGTTHIRVIATSPGDGPFGGKSHLPTTVYAPVDFEFDNDVDNDGVPNAPDCEPEDATVYPDAPELCDGLDNNCAGDIDEGGDALCDDGDDCTIDSCGGKDGCSNVNDDNACPPALQFDLGARLGTVSVSTPAGAGCFSGPAPLDNCDDLPFCELTVVACSDGQGGYGI